METVVLAPFLAFLSLAMLIALHHLYVHSLAPEDHARQESCPECCYLQPSDMSNHEIWVVALVCVALTWLVAGYAM